MEVAQTVARGRRRWARGWRR